MAVRKDGIKSKDKLLEAATEVFAEKGFREATILEISKRAQCNVAAINYHFKSKDELYAEVWKNAFELAMKVYPVDGGLLPDAPAEKRLYALIHSNLHRILDDGRLGYSGQILLRDMAEPTPVIEPILRNLIGPIRDLTRKIISDLLGPKATEQQISFCELSVVHQCIALSFAKSRGKLPPFIGTDSKGITSEFIDKLAEHITQFSLAGISAIRQQQNNEINLGENN
jgi:AcrR family transcriptional regulator